MNRDKNDLAEYLQTHKDDQEEWDSTAEAAIVKPDSSLVFSLRMKPSELAEFRRAATARGVPVSELIRRSALMYLRLSETIGVQVSAGKNQKIVFFGSPVAGNAGTKGEPDSTTTMPEPRVATG